MRAAVSFFGVAWVFPSSVWEALGGWKGPFVGRKRKGVWRAAPLFLFWTVWRVSSGVSTDDEELSIQMELFHTFSLVDNQSKHKRRSFHGDWFH